MSHYKLPGAIFAVDLAGPGPIRPDVNYRGTGHADRFTGTAGDDHFDLSQGGNDIVKGEDGEDTFVFGGALTAADRVNGGDGSDIVLLSGDYSAGLVLKATTLVNVEAVGLSPHHSYNFTLNSATVGKDDDFSIGGEDLGVHDTFRLDGSAVRVGHLNLTGGAGSDTLIGGANSDYFDLTAGGNDTVSGGAGDDTFDFGAQYTSADRIDGGHGTDFVELGGNYSEPVTMTMTSIEEIVLAAKHDYNLTLAGSGYSGQYLFVDASALGKDDSLHLQVSPVSRKGLFVIDGHGNDVIVTGDGSDFIRFTYGSGNDSAEAGGGKDRIEMGKNLNAADRIDGGPGNDLVSLSGNYLKGVTLGAHTIENVETFEFEDGHSYKMTASDGTVFAGATLTVNAANLSGTNHLIFDGSKEKDGHFCFFGGGGKDVFTGGLQADTFTGGASADTFRYTAVAQSTSTHFDTITDFNASADKFELPFKVQDVDPAVTAGRLDAQSFDSDLRSVAAAALGSFHTILFQPTSGSEAGGSFLIIDANGVAGYQSGADIVVELTDPANIGHLSVKSFLVG